MSAIPALKKKLKSVLATGKLSKAMKTVSASKYAKLSAIWKNYSFYEEEFRFLYSKNGNSENNVSANADTVVVMGSNRGFCGGFNNEISLCLDEYIAQHGTPKTLIVCGEEILRALNESKINPQHSFVFSDVPTFEECEGLFSLLSEISNGEKDYPLTIIHPIYKNTMTQIPKAETIFLNPDCDLEEFDDLLWIPSKNTVLDVIVEGGFRALVFGAIVETALGAQASTLMTMRSAYDTATEYSEALAGEIHRLRQSKVTADVIETASEHGNKGDDNDA